MTNLEFTVLHDHTKEILNQIYNHKETCELLIHKGTDHAIRHFYKQSEVLKISNSDHTEELRCIFLNSLNRCLYNYILFTWNISLSECCFQNKELTHAWISEKAIFGSRQKESYLLMASCLPVVLPEPSISNGQLNILMRIWGKI